MDLKDMRLFLAIAEENNLTRAAQKYGYTQSAASHMLRNIETELGFSLFSRSQRGLALTRNGEALLPPIRRTLAAADYAALLLERIETGLARQITLALPPEQEDQAPRIAREVVDQLPRIQQLLLTDIDAIFDGDPAAQNREEIVLAYPGLFAIFAYRVSHELYLRHVPTIPRMMSEYAHSRTGIDIHPGARIGSYFFIDHGTGIVVGETTVIGDHVKLYQGVTLGALSPRGGRAHSSGKRHPTVGNGATIYSGASIFGGDTVIGENAVVGGNAFLTESMADNARVVIRPPETIIHNL